MLCSPERVYIPSCLRQTGTIHAAPSPVVAFALPFGESIPAAAHGPDTSVSPYPPNEETENRGGWRNQLHNIDLQLRKNVDTKFVAPYLLSFCSLSVRQSFAFF